MKTLILYFSAEMGRTRTLAEKLQELTAADIFEIQPTVPYSKADVNYYNPLARCNKEHFGKKAVPIRAYPENFAQYDMVLLGFPIWYGCAPDVVSCFCDALEFEGKKLAVFATSGGDGIGKTADKLAPHIRGAELLDARLFRGADADELQAWLRQF